jgi:hypothetical protein
MKLNDDYPVVYTMKVPKKKFFYGTPSTQGDIPPRELTDVQPLLDHLAAIATHIQQAWDDDERTEADAVLRFATCALSAFQAMNAEHRARVLGDLPGHGLVDV